MSKINIKEDESQLKCIVFHESLHQLSAHGLLGGSRGLNECVTEYITRLGMGEDYVNGYCLYEGAARQLETMVYWGMVSEEQILRAYFSNDVDLLRNHFDGINPGLFDKICTLMDKVAIDPYSRDGITADRELDDLIVDFITKNR